MSLCERKKNFGQTFFVTSRFADRQTGKPQKTTIQYNYHMLLLILLLMKIVLTATTTVSALEQFGNKNENSDKTQNWLGKHDKSVQKLFVML
jgi:hypothetical protein